MEVTSGGLSSVAEVSTALQYGIVILPFSSCVSRYSLSLMDACSIFLDIAAEFWEWNTAPETAIAPVEVAAAVTEVLLRENRLKSQNFFRCSFSAIVFRY